MWTARYCRASATK